MSKPYRYRLRPSYSTEDLLLEFIFESSDADFVKDLFNALESINPKVDSFEDVWMNDEILLNVNSNKGNFLFSKDIWDFAFIMAKENQQCIIAINDILGKNPLFKKEEIDFEDYKKLD